MKSLDDMNEVELRDLFNKVAMRLKATLPPNTGFVVLATDFTKQGVAQYVSNVERSCAAKWMTETVARWEAGDHVPRGPA